MGRRKNKQAAPAASSSPASTESTVEAGAVRPDPSTATVVEPSDPATVAPSDDSAPDADPPEPEPETPSEDGAPDAEMPASDEEEEEEEGSPELTPERITHAVLRILQGTPDGDIYAGTPDHPVFVDASEWANTPLLVQSGHLRPVTDEEIAEFEAIS